MIATTRSFELPLPGLREDNPRDFLAALGLLRLVDKLWPECCTRLRWCPDTITPELRGDKPLPDNWAATLVAALLDLVQLPGKPMAHGEIIKTSYESFRAATQRAVEFARTDHLYCFIPVMPPRFRLKMEILSQADSRLETLKAARSCCLMPRNSSSVLMSKSYSRHCKAKPRGSPPKPCDGTQRNIALPPIVVTTPDQNTRGTGPWIFLHSMSWPSSG